MKAKEYNVLERAIEEGLRYGLGRVMKHRETSPDLTDTEERGAIILELASHVTAGVCEWFEIDREPETEAD